MIDGQPLYIDAGADLRLRKYYPSYRRTLPWYQDLELCRQVDDIDHPYDLPLLKAMYGYLCRNGECYYVQVRERGRFVLVGDVTLLRKGEIAVVIEPGHQNRGIGRRAVLALAERARELGYREVYARIYPFNLQSRRMFTAIGFQPDGEDTFRLPLGPETP